MKRREFMQCANLCGAGLVGLGSMVSVHAECLRGHCLKKTNAAYTSAISASMHDLFARRGGRRTGKAIREVQANS